MEKKTIENILIEHVPVGLCVLTNDRKSILNAMGAYASQRVELAVKKPLEMASDEGASEYGDITNDYKPRIKKNSIISLYPKVIETLTKD